MQYAPRSPTGAYQPAQQHLRNASPDPRLHRVPLHLRASSPAAPSPATSAAAQRRLHAAHVQAERLASYELLLRRAPAPPGPSTSILNRIAPVSPRDYGTPQHPGAVTPPWAGPSCTPAPPPQPAPWAPPCRTPHPPAAAVPVGFTPSPGTQRLAAIAQLPDFEARQAALLERRRTLAAEGQAREVSPGGMLGQPKPPITAAAAGLRRTIQDLEAWDRRRQQHVASAATHMADLARQQEAAATTFTPTINERSRKMAERVNALRSPAERPWSSPSPRHTRSASRSPQPRPHTAQTPSPPPLARRTPPPAPTPARLATTPSPLRSSGYPAPRLSSVSPGVPQRSSGGLSHTRVTVRAGRNGVELGSSGGGGGGGVRASGAGGVSPVMRESDWELKQLLSHMQDDRHASPGADARNSYAARYQQAKAYLQATRLSAEDQQLLQQSAKAAGGYSVGAFAAEPLSPPPHSAYAEVRVSYASPAPRKDCSPSPAAPEAPVVVSYAAAWAAAARAAEVSAAAAVVAATQALAASPPPPKRTPRGSPPPSSTTPVAQPTGAHSPHGEPVPTSGPVEEPKVLVVPSSTSSAAALQSSTAWSGAVRHGPVEEEGGGGDGELAERVNALVAQFNLALPSQPPDMTLSAQAHHITFSPPAATHTAAPQQVQPPVASTFGSATAGAAAHAGPVAPLPVRTASVAQLGGIGMHQPSANGFSTAPALGSTLYEGNGARMVLTGINRGMASPRAAHAAVSPPSSCQDSPRTYLVPAGGVKSLGLHVLGGAQQTVAGDELQSLLRQIESLRALVSQGEVGSQQVLPAWQELQDHMAQVLGASGTSQQHQQQQQQLVSTNPLYIPSGTTTTNT